MSDQLLSNKNKKSQLLFSECMLFKKILWKVRMHDFLKQSEKVMTIGSFKKIFLII